MRYQFYMRCPNCGASISDAEEKCPYCDSYLDTKKATVNIEDMQDKLRNIGFPIKNDPNYKPNILMVLISLFMPIGVMMFIINILSGRPKSAIACFMAVFSGTFIIVFCMIVFNFFSMSRSMPYF